MKLKIFFFAFLLSLPFWWAVNGLKNNMEGYWSDLTLKNNFSGLTAQVDSLFVSNSENKTDEIKKTPPEISATSGIVVKISKNGEEKILFSKNSNENLPIASLTKLMVADVIIENYNNLSQMVIISDEVAKDAGDTSVFNKGESFSLENLLYSMLLESNNEASEAISSVIGREALVDLMNLEVKNIGLINTVFYNPSGRDPREGEGDISEISISTANDLVKIAEHIILKPLMIDILQEKEKQIFSFDGRLHHTAVTTNEFLKSSDNINGLKIIAGKTGETKRAGQCLLLILEDPKTNDKIISVILNSDKRFEETQQILDWINK